MCESDSVLRRGDGWCGLVIIVIPQSQIIRHPRESEDPAIRQLSIKKAGPSLSRG
jgi:hypothetical protein